MDRRDFLLLRTGCGQPLELSGERLYMRFVDAEADGTSDRLFEGLAGELGATRAVRVTGAEWLSDERLKARIDPILARFRASGGLVQ